MAHKLVMLSEPLLVSDEEIKIGDFGYWDDADIIAKITTLKATSPNTQKIIAGIPELPSINFSLLSEEDCKTIDYIQSLQQPKIFDVEVEMQFDYADKTSNCGYGYGFHKRPKITSNQIKVTKIL